MVFGVPMFIGVVADGLFHDDERGEKFADLVRPSGTSRGELTDGRPLAPAVAGDELLREIINDVGV